MPHLHLHIYSFIDRIWALLATGATDFSNINVVSGNRPIGDLNLTHHAKAIKVLKALVDQVTLHQSQGTPILVQASITSKFCPLAATYPLFPKPMTPAANPPDTATRRDAKHTTFTTEAGGNNKIANSEQNKKVKVVETCGADRKNMGMFYLKNAETRAMDIFPRDLAEKICADFTCKERECTRDPCSFKHPCNPRDMDKVTVVAIARNFATTTKGMAEQLPLPK